MKYFKNIKSLEDLKSQYKGLLKINHPDNGGEVEKMQEINVQYDALFKVWKDRHEEKTGEQVTETAESTRSQFYTEFGWEGSNHDWNRSLKEVAKIVRAYVKEKYPAYKFSVRTSYASMCQELHVELKESPAGVYKGYGELTEADRSEIIRRMGYNGLWKLDCWTREEEKEAFLETWKGHGGYYRCLNDVTKAVIDDVDSFVQSYNYSDCDGMVDYFHVDFYYFGCCRNNGQDIKIVPKTAKSKKKAAADKKEPASEKTEAGQQEATPQTEAAETPEINVNNYTYVILEDTDTRTGEKIYLVKVKESLSHEEYIQVNRYIKSLGGYYSRFKHGFIFKENPERKLYTGAITEEPEENTQETAAGTAEERKQETISYIITEDTHTKTGKKIWVAKPGKKLNRTDFAEVKQKLATLQGFYSTLKKGFVFTYNPEEILRTG